MIEENTEFEELENHYNYISKEMENIIERMVTHEYEKLRKRLMRKMKVSIMPQYVEWPDTQYWPSNRFINSVIKNVYKRMAHRNIYIKVFYSTKRMVREAIWEEWIEAFGK